MEAQMKVSSAEQFIVIFIIIIWLVHLLSNA